ncbi:MAG: hypothetical protein BWX59_02299 [Bacteroidetes bacterium ADurb.Bin028]|nr:MAG: hypothetical protein BWX59_02299 [Bacteroidetes bacterium ADurb.Bin028]
MKDKTIEYIRLVLIYLVASIIGTFFFILSFWLSIPFICKIDALFFKAIFLLIIVCSLVAICLISLKKKYQLSYLLYRDILIICLCLFFFNFNLYSIIPFNFSRSNSVILMGYLYNNKGLAKSEIEIKKYVMNKYYNEYNAISIRLSEQQLAGNIELSDDGYVITDRGLVVMEVMSFVTSLFNVNNDFSK